jgi:amidase
MSAVAMHDALRNGDVSPLEALGALQERIEAVEEHVCALPTLCLDRAHDQATAIMRKDVDCRGILAGMPIVIKDLVDVAGVRSTRGSVIFSDHIPRISAPIVQRLERAGGIVYAKSNTPEFGAGASTFNAVFPTTRNPHDLSKSVAGSSGGSAAALASGMAWLAHGSDLGGSLRNPASFCGVVGLRPSIGRVPAGTGSELFDTLLTEGPMARSVADVALFLDAMAGWETPGPLGIPAGAHSFLAAAQSPRLPRRVAFSATLGITPIDPDIAARCRQAAFALEKVGVAVVETMPDFTGAHDSFQVLRALHFATHMRDMLIAHRDALKPDVVWNIEKGLALKGDEIADAIVVRDRIARNCAAFFDAFDLLLTPATIVPPFSAEQRTVTECAGHAFESYIDWLAIAFAITLTGQPALSLPCGRTSAGLPIGLQLVGAPRGEGKLLTYAAALEEALGGPWGVVDPNL